MKEVSLTRRKFLALAGWGGATLVLSLNGCQSARQVNNSGVVGTTLLDLNLTSGDGSVPASIAANQFTLNGNPSFDAMGMLCTNGHIQSGDFLPANRAALAEQGTLHIQFERLGATYDNTWSSLFFPDSSGFAASAIERNIFHSCNAATNFERRILWDGRGNKNFLLIDEAGGKSVNSGIRVFGSRYVPGQYDSMYSDVVWTWSGQDCFIYLDGHLINEYRRAGAPQSDEFEKFAIGGYFGTSENRFGGYRIRRVRMTDGFSQPQLLSVKVGFLGDSFTVAGDAGSSPTEDTQAAIDAVQTGLEFSDNATQYSRERGQANWILFQQSMSWRQLGGYFRYYKAAKNGAGYERNPLPKIYRDAMIGFGPEIIVMLGSVNDVGVWTPVSDIVGNTKRVFDELIDGIPSLRTILFFETLSGHQCAAQPAGWLNELKRIHSLYRNGGINGYRGKVRYIETYAKWGGDHYDPHFSHGSNPDNHTSSGPQPYGPGIDLHPTASGHARIAEIVWPILKEELIQAT